MFAGHFATSIVLHKLYPETLPFTFSIGVAFLDLVFGVLAYYGYEGLTKNPNAGLIAVDLHCDYSHSLIGSLILSIIYGLVTGSFIPGFISSFSHFIEDWTLHNNDLLLDPYSRIVVGGTSLWSLFPIFSYYFEASFCVACAIYSSKDISTVIANLYIFYLLWNERPSNAGGLAQVAVLPDDIKQKLLFKGFLTKFGIPAITIGFILFKNYYDYKMKSKVKKN
ncbi:unnamed protein product [Cunninghamella blakesleeana]